MTRFIHLVLAALAMAIIPRTAFARIGVGSTSSFTAGLAHPFGGLDHVAVMIAVGLWAALKGGRALWIWLAAFVGVMLVGGALGTAHVPMPMVEPGILASVVALGLLVALAVDLPVWLGAVIIGAFAVFHGHAHGSEVVENVGGIEYMAGFALATATLHLTGIGIAIALAGAGWRPAIRVAGAACVVISVGVAAGLL